MKKALAFILAVLYLSTSMGATVHLHYCMGRLVDLAFLDHENKDCTFCGMPKPQPAPGDECTVSMKGCCHDEHKHFKNDNDQKAPRTFFDFSNSTPAITSLSLIVQAPFINAMTVDQPSVNGPPLLNGISLYLRNCIFRI